MWRRRRLPLFAAPVAVICQRLVVPDGELLPDGVVVVVEPVPVVLPEEVPPVP